MNCRFSGNLVDILIPMTGTKGDRKLSIALAQDEKLRSYASGLEEQIRSEKGIAEAVRLIENMRE